MNLISFPLEVRAIIYDFSFPPPPHSSSINPLLRLSPRLPSQSTTAALPRLQAYLHETAPARYQAARARPSLHHLRTCIGHYYTIDSDPHLAHFESCLRFAERLRLVGFNKHNSKLSGVSLKCESRRLTAGPECTVRVLEVQPGKWGSAELSWAVKSCLGNLFVHPDVAARLQVRLIRDGKEGAAEDEEKWAGMEEWLKWYQDYVYKQYVRGR